MEESTLENHKFFIIKCKCGTILSAPFDSDVDYIENKTDLIFVDRYKGQNINYDIKDNHTPDYKLIFSKIYCSNCFVKLGIWFAKCAEEAVSDLNYLSFERDKVDIIDNNSYTISEEQALKYQVDEKFYCSTELTKDFFLHMKEGVDNFIKNVKLYQSEKQKIKERVNALDYKLSVIKKFFCENLARKHPKKLGIDFQKKQIKNVKNVIKEVENEESEDEKEDKKENKKKEDKVKNDNDNYEKKDFLEDTIKDELINFRSKSDIYKSSKINNKEPSNVDDKNKNNKKDKAKKNHPTKRKRK